MKRTPLSRGKPLTAKKPMRKVSAKRQAYRASAAGQAATAHMMRVKRLPCVICGVTPCDAHHVIHGRYGARKASDWHVIPLCEKHHRYPYPEAIHTDKKAWEQKHGPDYSYLDTVAEKLGLDKLRNIT